MTNSKRLLSEDFLAKYSDFPSEMNALGKFVYLRTYSRWLPDKQRRETWKETCARATEYNMSLAPEEFRSVEETEAYFDNMFHVRQFLSGRTLWVGGTPVAEKYPMSNFNCFSRDTEFLTDKGIKTFNDFKHGDTVNVLNKNGAWSEATVKTFGEQPLVKLTLKRGKAVKVIHTTASHVWLVNKYNDGHSHEVQTKDLKIGNVLKEKRRYEHTALNACAIGIQHGIVYGDGTYDKTKNHCRVSLQGKKQGLAKYITTGTTCTEGNRDSICIYGLPANWKELPSEDMNYEYWKGFLIGLIATDGSVDSGVSISSSNLEELKILRGMAEAIGLPTYDIRVVRGESNLGSYAPCYGFSFIKDLFNEDMLIRADQKASFSITKKGNWVVSNIEDTNIVEDVWCVVEPKTSTFTLSSGVLTHNCAFTVIEKWEDFRDLFYLLMVGTGVGLRVLRRDVAKLKPVRQNVELVNLPYIPNPKFTRTDDTSLVTFENDTEASIIIGDSKEGWVDALYHYFRILTEDELSYITKINVIYDNIRPKGERLKTFGGTASGGESMVTMFEKIHNVLTTDKYAPKPVDGVIRPIHALDIANIIGSLVVVGGVRRTAEIALLDPNDKESVEAKLSINADNSHRYMSNNSVFYEEKPTRAQLAHHFEVMRRNGEPGFVNATSARDRKPTFEGMNPCAEILLQSKQLCNLVTTNAMGFVKDGYLDLEGFVKAHRLNARSAVRMTLVNMELPEWDKVHKSDRIVGVSMLGWYDMLDSVGIRANSIDEVALLRRMKRAVRDEVKKYCAELGIEKPELVTTMKPEGTLSKVAGGRSPGAHRNRAEFYIRRVRVNASDPMCRTLEAQGWNLQNEVGQGVYTSEGVYVPVTTKVAEFPVASGAKTTTLDVSALDQLQTYYNFQDFYTDHNTSITVDVDPEDWKAVEQNIWDNWNNFVAVSFLERFTDFYPLLPEEPCSEEEYNRRLAELTPIDTDLLNSFERELETAGEDFDLSDEQGCSNGLCPVR